MLVVGRWFLVAIAALAVGQVVWFFLVLAGCGVDQGGGPPQQPACGSSLSLVCVYQPPPPVCWCGPWVHPELDAGAQVLIAPPRDGGH